MASNLKDPQFKEKTLLFWVGFQERTLFWTVYSQILFADKIYQVRLRERKNRRVSSLSKGI